MTSDSAVQVLFNIFFCKMNYCMFNKEQWLNAKDWFMWKVRILLLKVYFFFFEITHQYLFFLMCLLLSWDSLSNLSQETVLRLTTIDMLMKMGCGNTFGKLPWPEVRQDCSFSYKYICSLKEKKPGNCYLRANLTVKTLAMHSRCVKSEWSFKFVYFTVSKVWVVPVEEPVESLREFLKLYL